MNKRNFLICLGALHLLFYVLGLTLDGIRIPDSYDYLYQAENIRSEGSFYAWTHEDPYKPDYETKRTPLYGLFLLILGSIPALILLVQNLLSVLLWFLVYRLLMEKGLPESRAGWLILGVLLVQSNTLIYANSILSETIFQFLVFYGFYWLLKDQENRFAWLWAAMIFGLAVLTKPVLLFFWIPLMLWAVYRSYRLKMTGIVWFALLPPLAIVGWSQYNEATTGYGQFTSIGTVNLKDYNTRLMLESVYGNAHADSVIAAVNDSAGRIADYGERDRYIRKTCSALILEHSQAYAKIHLKGMLALLLDPGRYDYVQFFRQGSGGEGLMAKLASGDLGGMWQTLKEQSALVSFFFALNLAGSVLLLFAALMGVRSLRRQPLYVFLIVAIIGYFWILTGPVGTARYKSAILPFMVLLAGLYLAGKKKSARVH